MSLIVPAVVAAGALFIYSDVERKRAVEKVYQQEFEQSEAKNEPHQGVYLDPRKQWAADTRGRFVSMQEITDVNGARVFLVDYGTGGKVYQYADPRVIW